MSAAPEKIRIAAAEPKDTATILQLIRELAEYEHLAHMVSATEIQLHRTLFGARPAAEVLLANAGSECVGFALFFGTYSTFLGKPGLWLEDLYVKPHVRGKGIGRALLSEVAMLALSRECGR